VRVQALQSAVSGTETLVEASGSRSPSCLRRPTMGCSTQCLPASASLLHLRRRPHMCLPGSTSTGPRGMALHQLHGIVAMGQSQPCVISRPMVSL
jgi:hypothetical protein